MISDDSLFTIVFFFLSQSTGTLTPPGQSHQFIARLKAPAQPGSCFLQWRMVRLPGQFFGPVSAITVQIDMRPNEAPGWEAYE
jgi:hypothetical protein